MHKHTHTHALSLSLSLSLSLLFPEHVSTLEPAMQAAISPRLPRLHVRRPPCCFVPERWHRAVLLVLLSYADSLVQGTCDCHTHT